MAKSVAIVIVAIIISLVLSSLYTTLNPTYVTRTEYLTLTEYRTQTEYRTLTETTTITRKPPPPSRTVIFRLDDVAPRFLPTVAREIVETFLRKGVPLTVAIVPNNRGITILDDVELSLFLRTVAKNSGLIEIAMHGWNHTEYPTGGEFKGRPFEDQLYYILEGKRLLDHVFSNATGPVVTFTVTYNLYDENTVKAAKQAGFKIFSSKLKQHWWDNGVTPPTRHNNFHEGLLFLDWNFYLIKDETTFELHAANEVLETCRLRTALYGVCVIMFHVQELSMNWQDRVDLDKLRKFEAILDSLLGAGEFEFMTMSSYYLRRSAAANP